MKTTNLCAMCGRGRYVPAAALHVATDAELVCDYCGHETYRAPRAYRAPANRRVIR